MPGKHTQDEISKVESIRQFLLVFLPFSAVLMVGAMAHYYTITQTERVTRESSELLNVGLARSELNRDLANVISDLMFLSSYLERWGSEQESREKEAEIAELFLTFSREKQLYDQIRYLDTQGKEVVRINFRDGRPIKVPQHRLQDKAGRYYFQETLKLDRGNLYISPLDLNIEQGVIEKPLKPMMRFAIPLYTQDGGNKGILVLNYLGDRMLGNFSRAGANIADHIHLVNADGYWLRSPQRSDEWGFMFPHGKRFADRYPEAWKLITQGNSGQVNSTEGLFTVESVTPGQVAAQLIEGVELGSRTIPSGSDQWKVIAVVDANPDGSTIWQFLLRHLPLYLVVFAVLLVGSWLLMLANLRHLRAELQTEYERRFRHTLENMQLAAVTVDQNARLVFCNDYFLQLTDWTRSEVINQDWIERFVITEQQNSLRETFASIGSSADFPREMEAEIVTRGNANRLIAWHNTPAFDAGGKVVGFTGVGEDITERKRAEEEVRKLYRAVEQSPSIVMLTDRYGRIEYVNPKFTEVTGYTPEDVIGENPRILKSGETSVDEYGRLWQSVLEGKEWRGEFHNQRKNGELYWESASISALRGPDGEITDIIAVKEDITQRKQLEMQVEERNRELARNQALTAMGRMASMIAHDLRNPLSSVKMGLQIISKQVTAESRELSQIALDQIFYMENILTDMLTYARPEAVKTDWVSLDKLLDVTLGSLQKRIDEARVEVAVRYQSGLPTVPADANKLRQVFSNLIINALQSVEQKPVGERHLYISTMLQLAESGTAIQVEICDDGAGLDESETEKLFEPFFTTRTRGTGLGLAIVRQIVEQHGGSVTLQQRAAGGACALVVLPTSPSSRSEDLQ